MNDLDFELLDELYFVTSFRDLAEATSLPEDKVASGLKNLLQAGYVKALFPDPDTEIAFSEEDFERQHQQYYYLATKAGLLAHNSK